MIFLFTKKSYEVSELIYNNSKNDSLPYNQSIISADITYVKLYLRYQQYIHKSRYARFIEEEKRRESYIETVSRYFDFMSNHLKTKHKHIIPKK